MFIMHNKNSQEVLIQIGYHVSFIRHNYFLLRFKSSTIPFDIKSTMDSSYHGGGNLYFSNPKTYLNGDKLAWAAICSRESTN